VACPSRGITGAFLLSSLVKYRTLYYCVCITLLDDADEEDYFKEDNDEDDSVSCIVANGTARPPGGVTGGFSLSSLVEYGDDEDDEEDSQVNGVRGGQHPLFQIFFTYRAEVVRSVQKIVLHMSCILVKQVFVRQ